MFNLASSPADPMHAILTTAVAAISAGTLLQVLARRLGIPSLVLLIAGGVILGPHALGLVQPDGLGVGLLVIVELAIGLILFEGGLTLRREGYRSAPTMIRRLLSIGVVVTWMGTAIAIWTIADVAWNQAVMAASLVIVTGPTVIAPLLKRIRVLPKLHSILHWESVLIDPIGVFVAVLCFEWLGGGASGNEALVKLGLRAASGMAIGLGGGLVIAQTIRWNLVPRELLNIFTLAAAVLVFGIAEAVVTKAGLLAVTVAGFVLGLTVGPAVVRQLRAFKAEFTDLLIGILFIILTARLNFDQFESFGWRGFAVVALVIFAIRPLSILLCSMGLDLTIREKTFLSWIAPRGIVAASMASLLAVSLEQRGAANPRFVETFTYSVIVCTIVLQGITAKPVARALGVLQEKPTGWMIVGAHAFARGVADFLHRVADRTVILVDTSERAVREAQAAGFRTINSDARDTELLDQRGISDVGNVLALTDNEDLNARLCQRWADVVGPAGVFRNWSSSPAAMDEVPGTGLWPSLPRPAILAGEIARGEATIAESDPDQGLPAGAVILSSFDGHEVVFDPPLDEIDAEEQTFLYLQRQADYLLRSVRADLILTLEPADLKALFEEGVKAIGTIQPQLPHQATVDDLLQRESAFPSSIGHGVAVPHGYSRHIKQRLCSIIRVKNGLPFAGDQEEPVRLVFLLLSPQGDPEGHLATLADIARLVSSEEARERLIDADSALEVLHLVRQRGLLS